MARRQQSACPPTAAEVCTWAAQHLEGFVTIMETGLDRLGNPAAIPVPPACPADLSALLDLCQRYHEEAGRQEALRIVESMGKETL
jgi:hypothetical protein